MRADGWPSLLAVPSVIEIASCSDTPRARTSSNQIWNCRIGFASILSLVSPESSVMGSASSEFKLQLVACKTKARTLSTNSHEIRTNFRSRRFREISRDFVDRTLDIAFTERERQTVLSPFGFFFFLGPHATDLLGFGEGQVVIDVRVILNHAIFQFAHLPIRRFRISARGARGHADFIRYVGVFFNHQIPPSLIVSLDRPSLSV